MRMPGRTLLVLLLWWLGMASAHADVPPPWRVGVLYWSETIPSQQTMRRGLERQAQRINDKALAAGERGLQLLPEVAGDGPEGVERQIRQMYAMIARRPDAIIVQPSDNAALAESLQRANQVGIPVIAYDQYIQEGELASYISTDNYQAGYLGGEYIAWLFDRERPLRLVLVEHRRVSSAVERLNGFLDGLTAQGVSYEVLKSYQAIREESGLRVGQEILRDFPEKHSIDAIFTVNNGGGLNVVKVLSEAGRDEIAIATVDGDPESVANIRQRKLTRIDSAQFCAVMGATAVEHAYRLLRGEQVARQTLIPAFPVTEQTLNLYPGWEGALPPTFDKAWPSLYPQWRHQLRKKD